MFLCDCSLFLLLTFARELFHVVIYPNNWFQSLGSWQVGAMAEEGKVRIDKFDGRGFGFWKMQIEDYLYQKKLHEPLSETKPEKINPSD